jgi:hypothetical protein
VVISLGSRPLTCDLSVGRAGLEPATEDYELKGIPGVLAHLSRWVEAGLIARWVRAVSRARGLSQRRGVVAYGRPRSV